MIAHQRNHLRAHVITIEGVNVESVQETNRWFNAGLFMLARTHAFINECSCRRLAKIMRQGGEHNCHLFGMRQVVNQFTRAIDGQQRMHPNVALGMPLGILRHIQQRLKLRKQLIDCAKLFQPP